MKVSSPHLPFWRCGCNSQGAWKKKTKQNKIIDCLFFLHEPVEILNHARTLQIWKKEKKEKGAFSGVLQTGFKLYDPIQLDHTIDRWSFDSSSMSNNVWGAKTVPSLSVDGPTCLPNYQASLRFNCYPAFRTFSLGAPHPFLAKWELSVWKVRTICYPTVHWTRPLLSDKLVGRIVDKVEKEKCQEGVEAQTARGSTFCCGRLGGRGGRRRRIISSLSLPSYPNGWKIGQLEMDSEVDRRTRSAKGAPGQSLTDGRRAWQSYSVLSHGIYTILYQHLFLFIIPTPKKGWLATWITTHQLPHAEWIF